MKVFFKILAIVFAAYTTITATEALVIGCRPWDENIKGVGGLVTAHFVDFQISGSPETTPKNFHHLDLNDDGPYSKESDFYKGPLTGKFSAFAKGNAEKFGLIIIDWITYQHIRRGEAWSDFATLLSGGGRLVVPVTRMLFGAPASKEKADEMSGMLLKSGFSSAEVLPHKNVSEELDLLQSARGGMLEAMLSFQPAIIIATK